MLNKTQDVKVDKHLVIKTHKTCKEKYFHFPGLYWCTYTRDNTGKISNYKVLVHCYISTTQNTPRVSLKACRNRHLF